MCLFDFFVSLHHFIVHSKRNVVFTGKIAITIKFPVGKVNGYGRIGSFYFHCDVILTFCFSTLGTTSSNLLILRVKEKIQAGTSKSRSELDRHAVRQNTRTDTHQTHVRGW